MNDPQAKIVPYTAQIGDLMTPAERWTQLGDSYRESEAGKTVMRDVSDWFKPVAVLENRMSVEDVMAQRSALLPIKGGMLLEMFGNITNTTESDDEIAIQLWASEAGEEGNAVEMITEPPIIKVFKKNDDEVTIPSEAFFSYMKEFGDAYNPYRESIIEEIRRGKEQPGSNKELY